MRLEHLSLTNFRNYARLELALPSSSVVLVGSNAQGKTSLLEAIYYLATSRSPYTTHDRQLIHWRTETDPIPFAKLSAEFSTRQATHQTLDITLLLNNTESGTRTKKVIKHNRVDKRVMDVVGKLAVVLFLPQDLALVEGAPQDRRRFMDNTLSQVNAPYLDALERFEKTLPQRNALLKRIAEKRAKAVELGYWNEQLADAGAQIIAQRQQFLRELELKAQQNHQALTGGQELLTLHYQPSFMPIAQHNGQQSFAVFGLDLHRQLGAEDIQPQYLAQLEREQSDSILRGSTLSGPHRDELRLMINGRDAGLYGSRGQARTAVMALKLAELDWMTETLKESPLLLLDEVVAELDGNRRAFLLNRLSGNAQTLMTTAEQDIFPAPFLERVAVWRVVNGQIQP